MPIQHGKVVLDNFTLQKNEEHPNDNSQHYKTTRNRVNRQTSMKPSNMNIFEYTVRNNREICRPKITKPERSLIFHKHIDNCRIKNYPDTGTNTN